MTSATFYNVSIIFLSQWLYFDLFYISAKFYWQQTSITRDIDGRLNQTPPPLSWGAPQKPGPDRVKDIGFKYEPYLCNGCHDLMKKAISFDNVAIVYIKGNAYRIHFWYMSKDDATNIMNGSNLIDKIGVL